MNALQQLKCLLLKFICLRWQKVLAFAHGMPFFSSSPAGLHTIRTFHRACHARLARSENTSSISGLAEMAGDGNAMFYFGGLVGALGFVHFLFLV